MLLPLGAARFLGETGSEYKVLLRKSFEHRVREPTLPNLISLLDKASLLIHLCGAFRPHTVHPKAR